MVLLLSPFLPTIPGESFPHLPGISPAGPLSSPEPCRSTASSSTRKGALPTDRVPTMALRPFDRYQYPNTLRSRAIPSIRRGPAAVAILGVTRGGLAGPILRAHP